MIYVILLGLVLLYVYILCMSNDLKSVSDQVEYNKFKFNLLQKDFDTMQIKIEKRISQLEIKQNGSCESISRST